MRAIFTIIMPNEPFNTYVRKGTIGDLMSKILDALKPEAIYFTETQGKRTGILIANLDSQSQIPAYCEPWFLHFNAEIHTNICMTPEDLKKANLAELGKKWGSQ